MFARKLFAFAAAAALFVATAVPAFAWPAGVEGCRPITVADPAGYYLCHDGTGLHLSTHGPGDEHEFIAVLRTNGRFESVSTVRLESRDAAVVTDEGHTLVFRVRTFNYTDGVAFRIDGGGVLHLNLELDGVPVAPTQVYLGAGSVNPPANPFTIAR
ncbi:MAG: hypothetical protein HY329_17630 [Chloroflexi bacterium]|nr:hypothetical protein [Chloroflexota bacterium]